MINKKIFMVISLFAAFFALYGGCCRERGR